MKQLLAMACVIATLTTGCAAGDREQEPAATSPSAVASSAVAMPSPDGEQAEPVHTQASVDAVLDSFITANLMLTQMEAETLDDALAQIERAQGEWARAGDALRAGIPGVPTDTSDAVLAALDRTQTSMTAYVDCMRSTEGSGAECEDLSTATGADANDLGTQVATLIPYGSRSASEYIAALEGSTDAASAESDTGAEPPAPAADPEAESVAQSNAREKAVAYLDYAAFSRQGLIDQLEYEGFSTDDATYGADAVGADWREQAARKAQEYLDYSAFSRSGLIDQLEFEGFTRAQAEYGADAVGL